MAGLKMSDASNALAQAHALHIKVFELIKAKALQCGDTATMRAQAKAHAVGSQSLSGAVKLLEELKKVSKVITEDNIQEFYNITTIAHTVIEGDNDITNILSEHTNDG